MLLSEAVKEFMAARDGLISPHTIRNYEYTFRVAIGFLGDVEVSAVTPHHLNQLRGELTRTTERYSAGRQRPTQAGGVTANTTNSHIRRLKAFFRFLHDEGLTPANTAAKVKLMPTPPRPPKAISDENLGKMLRAAQKDSDPIVAARDYALIRFLAETGCRVGGLVSLTLGGLHFDRNRALVVEKGKKSRYVFFSDDTRGALAGYLAFHPNVERDEDRLRFVDGDAKVWWGRSGGLESNGVYQILQKIAGRAGIEGRFNPHSFRHRFAINYLDNGGDLASLSQIMGHSDTRVTGSFYARWEVAGLQDKHSQFTTLPDSDERGTSQGLRVIRGGGGSLVVRRKAGGA